jgi:hypothetical protein
MLPLYANGTSGAQWIRTRLMQRGWFRKRLTEVQTQHLPVSGLHHLNWQGSTGYSVGWHIILHLVGLWFWKHQCIGPIHTLLRAGTSFSPFSVICLWLFCQQAHLVSGKNNGDENLVNWSTTSEQTLLIILLKHHERNWFYRSRQSSGCREQYQFTHIIFIARSTTSRITIV